MEQSYKTELQRRRDFIYRVATTLGERAVGLFDDTSNPVHLEYKPDGTKVTSVDNALNALFIKEVEKLFDDDLVWGEEGCNREEGLRGYRDDLEAADKNWLWLIDPIDGTSGFWRACNNQDKDRSAARSDCTASIMITGFAPGATTPTLSAVANPFIRHPYVAVANDCFGVEYYTGRSDTPLSVVTPDGAPSRVADVQRYEENRWEGSTPDLRVLAEMMPYARKVRHSSVGGAMVHLALGDIDVVVFPAPSNPYDVAPGALIAHKAGAAVSDLDGTSFDQIDWRKGPLNGCVGAANSTLLGDFLSELNAR